MKITELAIKHHMAVLVGCFGILIIGVYTYLTMPRESFPDIEFPFIIVTTVLDGATPTDIEDSITIPLETELDGLEGLVEMRSTSTEGLSMITLEFGPEVPTETALRRVRTRVDQSRRNLSPEAEDPVIEEFSFTSIPVLIYQVVGGADISLSELDELAKKLEDDFRAMPEVLDVRRFGGRERKVVVEVDPQRLHHFSLPLDQVQNILRGSNRNISVGIAESRQVRMPMRVPGEFLNPGEIMQVVIGTTEAGVPIFLHNVATARFDFKDEESRARFYDFSNGRKTGQSSSQYVEARPAISLQIMKRDGANLLELSSRAKAMIAEYPFPEGIQAIRSYDQSQFVEMMLTDLENGIATSLILVLIVIFAGLGFRNALLVALAIPFSMLLAISVISSLGNTLNTMVMFALILSLGMLVDNAIVVVENIYRYRSMGIPCGRAALRGASDVGWPIIASTATTIGAFFPLLFWPGIMGQFMGFLPRTVIVVLLSSLLVALVINPTIAALCVKVRDASRRSIDTEKQLPRNWLVLKYQRILVFTLARPFWTLSTAFLILILVFVSYGIFGAGVEFFPEIDPDEATVTISPPAGISLQESDRLSLSLEDRIFGRPGSGWEKPIANLEFASVVIGLEGVGGNGINMFGGDGPIRINLEFVDSQYRTEPTTETVNELRRRIDGRNQQGDQIALPLFKADFDVVTPQPGPPIGAPVAIEIFGRDLQAMTAVIEDMKRLIEDTPGTVRPRDDAATSQTTLEWRVDRARAGMLGLSQPMVSSFLQIAVRGLQAGTFGHGDDEQDIMLRLPEKYRLDSERLKNITIPVAGGGSVPLQSVANAQLVPGPVTIRRLNKNRVLTAEAEVHPDIKADATIRAMFQDKVAGYEFPPGITYGFGQADIEQEQAQEFLLEAFGLAVFIILVVLVLLFNSVLTSAIVMVSVLLSLMGVFFGLLVMRSPFGIIMTGVGCISLAGVVVNNAIVMLDAIQRQEKSGVETIEAIVSAAMIRFRPVILTAITTILGLLPMALKLNFDFRRLQWQYNTSMAQFWHSMASAVVFGLLIATVMTLVVVPCLYLLQARLRERASRRKPLLNNRHHNYEEPISTE